MTDEERLAHERLVADIESIRGGQSSKVWWRELLQSSVAAALLTAIVGTFGAGILIARYQTRARRDELALAARRARTETQQRTVERALNLLAEGEYHARGRYAVTRRRFQVESVAAADADALRKQRETIITTSNDFEAMWPAQKKALDGLLKQSFPTNHKVVAAWTAAAASLDTLLQLARTEYDAYLKNPAVTVDKPPLPADADANLRTAIESLTAAVEQANAQPQATPLANSGNR